MKKSSTFPIHFFILKTLETNTNNFPSLLKTNTPIECMSEF